MPEKECSNGCGAQHRHLRLPIPILKPPKLNYVSRKRQKVEEQRVTTLPPPSMLRQRSSWTTLPMDEDERRKESSMFHRLNFFRHKRKHQARKRPLGWVFNMVDKTAAAIDAQKVVFHEKISEKTWATVLGLVGNMVKESAYCPYLPGPIRRTVLPIIEMMVDTLIESIVKHNIIEEQSRAYASYREMRVNFWAEEPQETGWIWMRAKILYALMPADGNMWTTLRDPLSVFINLLLFIPYTMVPMFLFTFVLIQKTDEYQLVSFILKFKRFQFVSMGVLMSQYMLSMWWMCLLHEQMDEGNACLDSAPGFTGSFIYYIAPFEPVRIFLVHYAGWLLSSGAAVGGPEAMLALENRRLDVGDGSIDGFADRQQLRALRNRHDVIRTKERAPNRVLLVWSTHILAKQLLNDRFKADMIPRVEGIVKPVKAEVNVSFAGKTRVSVTAVEVDAEVSLILYLRVASREDATKAATALGDFFESHRLHAVTGSTVQGGSLPFVVQSNDAPEISTLDDDGDLDTTELTALLDTHRRAAKAKAGTGGKVPLFLYYDLYVVLLCIVVFAIITPICYGFFLDFSSHAWWTSLYFFRIFYGILSFPFLVFNLPVIGALLHGAKMTGYDRSGALVPQLTSALLRKKIIADAAASAAEVDLQDEIEQMVHAGQKAGAKAGTAISDSMAKENAVVLIQRRARHRALRKKLIADGIYWSGGFCIFTRKEMRALFNDTNTEEEKMRRRIRRAHAEESYRHWSHRTDQKDRIAGKAADALGGAFMRGV